MTAYHYYLGGSTRSVATWNKFLFVCQWSPMYSWQVSRPLPGFLGQLQVLINYCASLSHGTNVPK